MAGANYVQCTRPNRRAGPSLGFCILFLVEPVPNESAGTVRKPKRRIVDLDRHLGPRLIQQTPARPSFVTVSSLTIKQGPEGTSFIGGLRFSC